MYRWIVILIVLILFSVSASFACDSAGSNVHIGEVTSIDSGTFTLLDAETNSPIKFTASPDLLLALAGLRRTIAVDYQQEEGRLVALAVR